MGSARGNDDGAAGVGSAPLRRALALLRSAEPTPAKGTFLFGERRGHFYRWTTESASGIAAYRTSRYSSSAFALRDISRWRSRTPTRSEELF